MKQNALIKLLNEKFDEINAVPREEFDGQDGIWLRTGYDYSQEDMYGIVSLMPEVQEVVKSAKYFMEPYDSETLMLYRN